MDLDSYVADLRERQARTRPAHLPDEPWYPIGRRPLAAHVAHWASVDPGRTALVADGREMTYAELDDASRRISGWLQDAGVRPGDRVGLLLPNSGAFVVAMIGLLRAGAVHVPINPMFQPHELAHELADAGVEVLVVLDALVPRVEAVRVDSPLRALLVVPSSAGAAEVGVDGLEVDVWASALAHAPAEEVQVGWDDLAALNYTGGTTGVPKGCEHTHGHLVYTAASTLAAVGLAGGRPFTTLCYIPVFWIAGEDLAVLLPFVGGGTSVVLPRWDAGTVLDLVERHRVTMMVGTVENYLELLDRPDLPSRDLSSLVDPMAVSFVRTLTPDIRHRWTQAVGEHSVLREGAYGMTETNTFDVSPYGLAADDRDLLAEPVFCGLPVPGTDVAVCGPGTLEPLPVGEVGEIVVRSPSVMRAYWGNQAATAEQLVDGWLRTGDNGRIDEDGCLHFLGRGKELIKVKGMSVFPAEVESLLARHPDVQAAAVVAAPHRESGQVPVAFVRLREGATVSAEELRTWARDNMAPYKVPVVELVRDFPMTTTGKIRKVELGERAGELAG